MHLDMHSNIASIMYDNYLSTIVANKLTTLFRHAVWHNDARTITAHSTHKREPYTLIAACRFNDNTIWPNFAAAFGGFNHL